MSQQRTYLFPFQLPSVIVRVLALAIAIGSLFLLPVHADTPVTLPKTEDAGEAYLDRLIFFGESTTTHLRARGGLPADRIWADASGTRMLSPRTAHDPIVYPPTQESLTLAQACAKAQPEYLVLSFGLNGIVGFANNPNRYLSCYERLIDDIRAASPNTKIILQTVYPVARADSFSVDTDTLNQYICTINDLLPQLASQRNDVRIADTASILRDGCGRLRAELADTDGIHLLPAAYTEILSYLRTHAWQF